MYKCQLCNTQSQPRDPQHTLVQSQRIRIYPSVDLPPLPWQPFVKRKSREGRGWEIQKELKVCQRCYDGVITGGAPKSQVVDEVAETLRIERNTRQYLGQL